MSVHSEVYFLSRFERGIASKVGAPGSCRAME